MHLTANAVPDQLADDAVAMAFGQFLNRVADILQPVALYGLPRAQKEALLRDADQLALLIGDRARRPR